MSLCRKLKLASQRDKINVGRVLCLFLLLFLTAVYILDGYSCHHGDCDQLSPVVTTFQQLPWRNATKKRILLWTGFFEDKSWENVNDDLFRRCRVKECTLTNDRRLFDESDAILFHLGALWRVVGATDLPSYRHGFQRWVLYNVEPPTRSPLVYHRLSGVFNWTSFYRLDSDIPVSYGGLYRHKRQGHPRNFSAVNFRLASWMSSNCHDYGERLKFIHEMHKHLPELDRYGRCGERSCYGLTCSDNISPYKFFFSIENAACRDYITEKFWEALRREQVPVVRGKKVNYEKVAPPHSYIMADDFSSPRDLAEYLVYLSKNPSEYNRYLKWTETFGVYGEVDARRKYFCDLCEGLHDSRRPAQVYSNLDAWANDELESCPQWTLMNQLSRVFTSWKYGFLY